MAEKCPEEEGGGGGGRCREVSYFLFLCESLNFSKLLFFIFFPTLRRFTLLNFWKKVRRCCRAERLSLIYYRPLFTYNTISYITRRTSYLETCILGELGSLITNLTSVFWFFYLVPESGWTFRGRSPELKTCILGESGSLITNLTSVFLLFKM